MMSSNPEHMPDWVIEVVSALDEYEDIHGQPDEWHCLAPALETVPPEVRTFAAGWRRHKKRSEPQT